MERIGEKRIENYAYLMRLIWNNWLNHEVNRFAWKRVLKIEKERHFSIHMVLNIKWNDMIYPFTISNGFGNVFVFNFLCSVNWKYHFMNNRINCYNWSGVGELESNSNSMLKQLVISCEYAFCSLCGSSSIQHSPVIYATILCRSLIFSHWLKLFICIFNLASP